MGIDTFVEMAPRESADVWDGVSLKPKTPTNTDSFGVNPAASIFTADPAATLFDATISFTARERTTAALG